MKVSEIIDNLLVGKDLQSNQAQKLFEAILSDSVGENEKKAALALLHKKVETASELIALIRLARRKSAWNHRLPKELANACDGCGTGGDQKGSFNISTIACMVAAAAGAHVAKHGNRSVTSRCGSSDLMESLGVNLTPSRSQLFRALRDAHIAYFHAPNYTRAFHTIQSVRKDLGKQGTRTLFNISGPLLNPLCVKRQVMGVYHRRYLEPVVETLKKTGTKKALVFTGEDGTDEITTHQNTYVAELCHNKIRYYLLKLNSFGLQRTKPKDLLGGTTSKNKKIALKLLSGRDRTTRLDAVLINAAALLYVSGQAKNLKQGIEMARQSICSGKALETLKKLIRLTHGPR